MADAQWADEAIRGVLAAVAFGFSFAVARLRWKTGGEDEQGQDSGLD